MPAINMVVDVVEGDAFLGRGARGRVVKVKRGDEIFALKVVDESSAAFLDEEARALTKAKLTGLTIQPMGECLGLTGSFIVDSGWETSDSTTNMARCSKSL